MAPKQPYKVQKPYQANLQKKLDYYRRRAAEQARKQTLMAAVSDQQAINNPTINKSKTDNSKINEQAQFNDKSFAEVATVGEVFNLVVEKREAELTSKIDVIVHHRAWKEDAEYQLHGLRGLTYGTISVVRKDDAKFGIKASSFNDVAAQARAMYLEKFYLRHKNCDHAGGEPLDWEGRHSLKGERFDLLDDDMWKHLLDSWEEYPWASTNGMLAGKLVFDFGCPEAR